MIDVPKAYREMMCDFATYCYAAYDDNPDRYIEQFKAIDRQFLRASTIASSGMFALIIRCVTNTVVAFRGTDELEDWETNVNARYMEINYPVLKMGIRGKVHSGFYERGIIMYNEIQKHLSDDERSHLPVYVCGHSLGGALAQIYTLERLNEGHDVEQLHTFGSPRVFGWRTARAFDKLVGDRHYRVVNNQDPVPIVPPWWSYRHSGRLAYINRKQATYFNTNKWDRWLDGAKSWRTKMPLRDHDITQYMEALNK